jgi:FkbM family methyltransferase
MATNLPGSSEQLQRIMGGKKSVYAGHPDQRFGPTTYAQHGDDLVLINIFENLGIGKPSYLDIGAHHPETISNTKLLYDRGSRGVNVDANPNLFKAFMLARPEDTNLTLGVTPKRGSTKLYMYSRSSGRNTLDPREVERMEGHLTVREEIEIPTVTINDIVDTSLGGRWPDLLTIDIEGLDYDVLESAVWAVDNRPKVVCVETRQEHVKGMNHLMYVKGYDLIFKCAENLIFIDSKMQVRALTGQDEWK